MATLEAASPLHRYSESAQELTLFKALPKCRICGGSHRVAQNGIGSLTNFSYSSRTPERNRGAIAGRSCASRRQQADDQRCSVVLLFAAHGALESISPAQQRCCSAPLSSLDMPCRLALCRVTRDRPASLAAPATRISQGLLRTVAFSRFKGTPLAAVLTV